MKLYNEILLHGVHTRIRRKFNTILPQTKIKLII